MRRLALALLLTVWVALPGCLRLGGPLFRPPDASWNALHHAALAGDAPLVAAELAAGADAAARTAFDDTALLLACRAGSRQTVRTLLRGGGDVNAANKAKASPVVAAAAYGHASLLAPLKQAGASLRADEWGDLDPLYQAVLGRHLEVVAEILRLDPEAVRVRTKSDKVLWVLAVLAKASSSAIQDLLVEAGLDLSARSQREDRKSLNLVGAYALLRGDIGLARIAVELGADLRLAKDSQRGQSLLHFFASPDPKKVVFVPPAPASLDPLGAARRASGAAVPTDLTGRLVMIEFLLAQGVDPRLRDKEGRTAMDIAIEKSNDSLAFALRMAVAGRVGAAREAP